MEEVTPVYEKLDVMAFYTVQYYDTGLNLVAIRHYTATELRVLQRVMDVLTERDSKWPSYVGKDLLRADVYRAWASPTNPQTHIVTLVAATGQEL